jgi:hypothetical protein
MKESEEESNYLLLLTQLGAKWEDKEWNKYHYANNVPNYSKITEDSKVIFCRYNNSKPIFLGHGQIKSISEENRGRTTPSGRQMELEKIAKIEGYVRFNPPKRIDSEIEESLMAMPNYNKQRSIVQITISIYNLNLSDRKAKNEIASDKEETFEDAQLGIPDSEDLLNGNKRIQDELLVDRDVIIQLVVNLASNRHIL